MINKYTYNIIKRTKVLVLQVLRCLIYSRYIFEFVGIYFLLLLKYKKALLIIDLRPISKHK